MCNAPAYSSTVTFCRPKTWPELGIYGRIPGIRGHVGWGSGGGGGFGRRPNVSA